MAARTETEKQVEKRLCDKVKELGGWTIKLLPFLVAGLPDRLVLLEGRAFFVELKAPKKRSRPDQLLVHRKLLSFGFIVAVLDSRAAVDRYIETLKDQLKEWM